MSNRKVVGYRNITAFYTRDSYEKIAYRHTEEVKRLIAQGWEPLGFLSHFSGGKQSLMCQTLVMYDTKDWLERLMEHLKAYDREGISSQQLTIGSNGEWYISYLDSEGIETTGLSGSNIETLQKVLGEIT